MHLSSLRPARTLIIVPVLALALSGCGQDLADSVTERVIEAAASEDVDIDIDTDGGGMTVKGEDGETSYSMGRGLPEAFPTDLVDLVDGEVGMSVSTQNEQGEGWAVTIQADGDDVESVFDDAVARLEAKGFEAPADGTRMMGEMRGQQMHKEPWSVTISVMGQAGAIGVQYVVVSGTP